MLPRLAAVLAAAVTGCSSLPPVATPERPPAEVADIVVRQAPWRATGSEASGHEPVSDSPPILLRGAKLLIGDGTVIARGHVLMQGGHIVSAGAGPGKEPAGVTIIDVRGKVITPGLIDDHSHLGVYPMPAAEAHLDGNEVSGPVTAAARAVDAFWPQDPGIQRAVAGGVTTIQALAGSANLIGGRSVTLKLRPAPTARQMHLRGAPDGLKMACGENPKRVYGGDKKQAPTTRMGNLALTRTAFIQARRLIDEWDGWRKHERRRLTKLIRSRAEAQANRERRDRLRQGCLAGDYGEEQCDRWRRQWQDEPIAEPEPGKIELPPKRDLGLETLAAALEGKILVHVHCYRADDMANMMALAEELGFRIRSFHHALEAYKIRRQLIAQSISISTWADWWGFKLEAYDGIPENAALFTASGGRAIIHSDSHEGIRRLNQEAAKAMYAGQHAGLAVNEGEAIRWITTNPAWALGIDKWTGSLQAGKDADVVVWDRSPFSVYARPERVFIDGFERHASAPEAKPWSDFEAQP